VRLAARGLRDMDGGIERVADNAALHAAREQARRVYWKSILAAAVPAMLYMVIT
jgi:hypothetical protein